MKKPSPFTSSVIIAVLALCMLSAFTVTVPAEARKVKYKFSEKKSGKSKTASDKTEETGNQEMAAGSFMVASQCEDCNSGYRLDQVVFAGFDKNRNSSVESFFITNNTDRTLTGISLYIEYLTPGGSQLHKKFIKLDCRIPAGETRKADIKSWDTQRSFYYIKSNPGRNGGTPFDVRFDPIAYYLSF